MFELSGVNYEEVLEQGDSILVRVIASSSYRGFELSGLYCSENFENHVLDVRKVLRCLRGKGVKLNQDKCQFFRTEIRYLGRLIPESDYRPDPDDIEALEKCKVPPENVGELRSIIGFLAYRTYLKDFSRKLKAIYDLLHKESDGQGQRKNVESKRKIEWKPEFFQNIINRMVEDLKSPNVIAYPDFSVPFTAHCDAS